MPILNIRPLPVSCKEDRSNNQILLEPSKWYKLVVETVGEEMRVL